MIEITVINNAANLVYFAEYLDQYDFVNFIVGVDNLIINFETQPTQEQENEIRLFYSAITELDWLDIYKKKKFDQIDKKTEDLISNGYTFAGERFSLSEDAQTNILALYATKDDPILTYPVTFNTLNDLSYYEAADASIISAMYYAALATKKGYLDSGTALKNQVRSAATINEVDLILDNRVSL